MTLAEFLADYVNEELARRHSIDAQTMADALDAWEGGAGQHPIESASREE